MVSTYELAELSAAMFLRMAAELSDMLTSWPSAMYDANFEQGMLAGDKKFVIFKYMVLLLEASGFKYCEIVGFMLPDDEVTEMIFETLVCSTDRYFKMLTAESITPTPWHACNEKRVLSAEHGAPVTL